MVVGRLILCDQKVMGGSIQEVPRLQYVVFCVGC